MKNIFIKLIFIFSILSGTLNLFAESISIAPAQDSNTTSSTITNLLAEFIEYSEDGEYLFTTNGTTISKYSSSYTELQSYTYNILLGSTTIKDIEISGEYLYVSRISEDQTKFLYIDVFNINDLSSGAIEEFEISLGSSSIYENEFQLSIGGDKIAVMGGSNYNFVWILDISTPTNLSLLSTNTLPANSPQSLSFHKDGNILAVSSYRDAYIYDVDINGVLTLHQTVNNFDNNGIILHYAKDKLVIAYQLDNGLDYSEYKINFYNDLYGQELINSSEALNIGGPILKGSLDGNWIFVNIGSFDIYGLLTFNMDDGTLYDTFTANSTYTYGLDLSINPLGKKILASIYDSYNEDYTEIIEYTFDALEGASIDSVTDTPLTLFHPLELTLSSYDTSEAGSFSSNGVDEIYQIYQTYNSTTNNKFINIEKFIFDNTNIHNISLKVLPSTSEIDGITQVIQEFNTTTNIISLQEDNISTSEMFLKNTLSYEELNTQFARYQDLNFSISFPEDSKGYELYKKQLVSQCTIDSYSALANTQQSSMDQLKAVYIYDSSDSNASDQNILIYNKYDSSKGLQLTDDGSNNLYEIDLDTGTQSTSPVATWSENTTTTTCSKNTGSISSSSIITLNFSSSEEEYGYENIALIKNDSTSYYEQGSYIPQDELTKEIYLNKEATEYLATQLNMNSTLYSRYSLDHDWTYFSIPTNTTICTQNYQSTLDNICNQNATIESVFGTETSTKPISLFKYRGGYWSHYTTEDKTYNMDSLTSINHTDGLLIYSEYEKDLLLPFDIYALEIDTFELHNITGWHLVGNQLQRTPSDLESEVTSQGQTLKYLMKQSPYNTNSQTSWSISAPSNDSDVDSSIDRIDTISPKEALWIYVE